MTQHYSASDAADSCAAFPAVELTYPFGPETQVYKVVGRMFAAMNADGEHPRITLKSDPEDAKALVETMAGGYIGRIGGELAQTTALALIIITLLFRPTGLYGSRSVERV